MFGMQVMDEKGFKREHKKRRTKAGMFRARLVCIPEEGDILVPGSLYLMCKI